MICRNVEEEKDVRDGINGGKQMGPGTAGIDGVLCNKADIEAMFKDSEII